MQAAPPLSPNTDPTPSEDRRDALKRIISQGRIGRQSELVRLLKSAGHDVTQSSVSRDLRDLGVAKIGDRYVLEATSNPTAAGLATVAAFVQSVVAAGPHLIVIRTTTGSASSVAAAIDQRQWSEIVGTLSGDDTVFVATTDAQAQRALLARLKSFQPR